MLDPENKLAKISKEEKERNDKIRMEEACAYAKETMFHKPDGFFENLRDSVSDVHPELWRLLMSSNVYDIWQRPVLDNKTRALIAVAVLTAIGAPYQVDKLVKVALANGITEDEIYEALIQCIPEIGFNLTWTGMKAAKAAIASYNEGKSDF